MADKWEERTGPVKDNWDDEEETDNVKDDWDQEDEAPKNNWDDEVPKAKPKATVTKPKANVEVRDLTEEERKQAQINADLGHTLELFGASESLDKFKLDTKENCADYVNRLYAKINLQSSSSHYNDFLDELFKALTKNLPHDAVRKLSNSLKAQADAKQAEERASKTKDAKKAKPKGRIKLEADRIKGDFDSFLKDSHRVGYDDDDDDDFM